MDTPDLLGDVDGKRARDTQHPVIAARGEPHRLGGVAQTNPKKTQEYLGNRFGSGGGSIALFQPFHQSFHAIDKSP